MNEDALTKALAAATEAAADSQQLEVVKAVLIAQAISRAADQPQHTCQHDHQQPKPFDAKKWWTIGGFAVVGGCVACALALAFALAATAVAIAATCATGCFLILRSLWRDYAKHR
ncbi:hypothetical protein BIU87_20740 [Streptomyces sp. ZS0098]|uniref:hypothetical protein n=1 Tax=unclassified Streptomyces TaxID=2593676 RepID=UPI000EFBABB8|nr:MULTISPECIES: hypothetical protein [unclassified Streptomyces]MBJ6633354.1 hypothetical protein [Streptomyces sp. I5]RMI92033.1 hypothetical protein BIU87_20740 [Streptomyces sp. ZS0098]